MLLFICELAVHFCVVMSSRTSDSITITRQPSGLQMCMKLCSTYGTCQSHTFDPVQLRCTLEIKTVKRSSCHNVNQTTEICATRSRYSRTIHPRQKGLRNVTQTLKVSGNKNADNKGVARNKNTGKISATRNKKANKKDAKPSYKGHKKESYIGRGGKASDTSTSQDKDCILFLRENLTIDSPKQLIALPLAVKPGMKISVYGGCVTEKNYCNLRFRKDPNSPKFEIVFQWIIVSMEWTKNYIVIKNWPSRTNYKGSFPISDPTHFNLTVKLSSSSTKITCDMEGDGQRHVISEMHKSQDLFRDVTRGHRVARFFIGGIDKKCTETGMRSFPENKGIRVTQTRFNNNPYRRAAWAQLNVYASDGALVDDPSFWPEHIIVKKWVPWSQYQKRQSQQ